MRARALVFVCVCVLPLNLIPNDAFNFIYSIFITKAQLDV